MDESDARGQTDTADSREGGTTDPRTESRTAADARWGGVERIVDKRLGGLEGLAVVQFGTGDDSMAARMAAAGARVTVVDGSPEALANARRLFQADGVPGEFVEANVLALPKPLQGAYDVSMSCGFASGLAGADRAQAVSAHVRALRHGGIAFITVPNAAHPRHRIRHALSRLAGVDDAQLPIRRREFEAYLSDLGVADSGFISEGRLPYRLTLWAVKDIEARWEQ